MRTGLRHCLRHCLAGLLAGGLLASAGQALAEHAPAAQTFSVQGFGTLGAVRTTSNDVEFVRDLGQPRGADRDWDARLDSVLGLQALWQISPQWQLVAQGVSHFRHDGSFRPELAWGFVKYEPIPNLSLRAGRLGTEFFMLADSRRIGYSFLAVRPPGDFFWYLPFYSIHGGDVALAIPVGDRVIRAKAFYGLSQGKVPLADEQWDVEGSPMLGAYLEYQAGPWQLRGSYANIRFRKDLPLAPVFFRETGMTLPAADADYLSVRNKRTHYYSLGLVYDRGPWQAQLMLNHIEQGSKALENSAGGYFLLGYRVGEWTPYAGYSRVRSQRHERAPSLIAARIISDSHTDQETVFAGARWDFARNTALKLQWDAIRGDAKSLFPYRDDDRKNWSGSMDVFSLSLDFIF